MCRSKHLECIVHRPDNWCCLHRRWGILDIDYKMYLLVFGSFVHLRHRHTDNLKNLHKDWGHHHNRLCRNIRICRFECSRPANCPQKDVLCNDDNNRRCLYQHTLPRRYRRDNARYLCLHNKNPAKYNLNLDNRYGGPCNSFYNWFGRHKGNRCRSRHLCYRVRPMDKWCCRGRHWDTLCRWNKEFWCRSDKWWNHLLRQRGILKNLRRGLL